jgi:60 kDa SS-A/Ro ribonucleoprotein
MRVLIGARTYAAGRGQKGRLTWQPVARVVDALDRAFYLAFGAVTPTGARMVLALDVSGSMGAAISGQPITCREAAAAMALVTMNVEPGYEIVGFTAGSRPSKWAGYGTAITRLAISPRQRLDDVTRYTGNLQFGGTDCALPMLWATEHKVPADVFVIYTDNETWAGSIQPVQALQAYRQRLGIPARLVTVGMTATGFTLADPTDAGMLDCVGFDTSTPEVIADFAAQ